MNNLFINRYAYKGNLFYKKPDLQVIRVKDIVREVGFTNETLGTWMFSSSDSTTLLKRIDEPGDSYLKLSKESEEDDAFEQLKVYRDAERNVYYESISFSNETGVYKKQYEYLNVFSETDSTSEKSGLIEVWNFDTWNTFASLAIEKAENLVWLNKATLGK